MQILKLKRTPRLLQHAVVCPSCGSLNFHYGMEEFYCTDCSLVILNQ